MKNKLLVGLAVSAFLLGGCGQEVDGIKAEFAKKEKSNAEQEFAGYTAIVSKEARSELKEFTKTNRLPRDLISRASNSDEEVKVVELPELDFTPDALDEVVATREKAKARLAEIKKEVKASVDEKVKAREAEIAQYEAEIASLSESIAAYKAMFADEQKAYDEIDSEVVALEKRIDERKTQFYAEFKEVVIANDIPLDANSKVNPTRYYKKNSERYCKRKADQDNLTYLNNPKFCIYVAFEGKQEALEPVFRTYGVDYWNMQEMREAAKDKRNTAYRSLSKAKTIASNKTATNVKTVERKIKNLERQAERAKSSMEREQEMEYALSSAIRSDDTLREIGQEYSNKASEYHKLVKKEAFDTIGVEIGSFDDERELPELSEGDKGMAVYVFTNESDAQTIYMAPFKASRNTKTYGDLFKGEVRKGRFDFEVNGEDDVSRIVEIYL